MLKFALDNFKSIFLNRKKAMLIALLSIALSVCGILFGFSLYDYFDWLDNNGIGYHIKNEEGYGIDYYLEKCEMIIKDSKVSGITLRFDKDGFLKYSYKDKYYLVEGRKLQNNGANEIVLEFDFAQFNDIDDLSLGDQIEIGGQLFTVVGFTSLGNYINRDSLENFSVESVSVSYNVRNKDKNYYKYFAEMEEVFGEGTVAREFRPGDHAYAFGNLGFYISILLIILAALNMSFQFDYTVNCNKTLNRAFIISGYDKSTVYSANLLFVLILMAISLAIGEIFYLIVDGVINVEISLSFIGHLIGLAVAIALAVMVSSAALFIQLHKQKGAKL